MKNQRDWVFKTCNRTRWSKNGKGEDLKSSKLASAEKYEKYIKVFRVGKLL